MLEVGSGAQVPTFRNSTYLDPQVGLVRDLGARHVLLVPQAIEDTLPNDMLERQNRDTVTTRWHHEFLDLCRTAGLFILNGRTPGDISGEYTCLSNKGFSIVDYFLTTADQLDGVKHLEVNHDEKYSGHKDAHFDHRPLVLTIT